ncbi:MAG: hypothetical protein CL927_02540 [Deltaproteobacteria bacterium]|nr:hypothetical protein [Deltaproteobacteria bacterium]
MRHLTAALLLAACTPQPGARPVPEPVIQRAHGEALGTTWNVSWVEAEGAGDARAFSTDPIPGNPTKSVLQQVAVGDNQVTTLGAQFLARGHGAVLIDNAVRPVWGLEEVSGSTTQNVLVEYEYGIEEPYVNLPPSDPDPHEWPRRERTGQDQIDQFFATGTIESFCTGPCGDPTRGQE